MIPAVKRVRFDRRLVTRREFETVTIDHEAVRRRVRREYPADVLILDMDGAPDIPAHMASEGTLLVLGVLTVMMGPAKPRLVLLDDFELALHPKAQAELVRVLRSLLDDDPGLPIVSTSHSPFVLDELRHEEVRLTTTDDSGDVVCSSLAQHPDFEQWKEAMTPGEMWRMFGEEWLRGIPVEAD